MLVNGKIFGEYLRLLYPFICNGGTCFRVMTSIFSKNVSGHSKKIHIKDVIIIKLTTGLRCFDQKCHTKWITLVLV